MQPPIPAMKPQARICNLCEGKQIWWDLAHGLADPSRGNEYPERLADWLGISVGAYKQEG